MSLQGKGKNADNGLLEIWNSNPGVIMNYSLSTDIPWIGITPLEGASSGPDDKEAARSNLFYF